MIIGIIYKEKVVSEVEIFVTSHHSGKSLIDLPLQQIADICMNKFGLDISEYRLSDMRHSVGKRLDFLLKEEDYIKLREDKINKILSE